MPSNAYTNTLKPLLLDADDLEAAFTELMKGTPPVQFGLEAINRAVVIASVSAWEAYVEEVVREAVQLLRPPAPPLGVWPALNATIRGQLGRFNTPNVENVRMLISDALGLPDIQAFWAWRNSNSASAVQRLTEAMTFRHHIAHGVHPRPTIHHEYAIQLTRFFRQLGLCTDEAIRNHLITTLGITFPWPP